MRVIRTEMYFDDQSVNGSNARRRFRSRGRFAEEKNHGIAFAWFRNDGDVPINIRNYKWFDGREIEVGQVSQALDVLLRDGDQREIYRVGEPTEKIQNPSVIDFIFGQDVVLEHSPPFAIPFKNLLEKTNSAVLIGAYVGYAMAGDDPLLMILTIPGGIIVVGSALGIADAMAYGLNKQIKRLFDGK